MPDGGQSVSPPRLVLIHSPLVGPFTWQPVATVLRRRGYEVVVPTLSLAEGSPYFASLTRQIAVGAATQASRSVVLVAHSGAGALIPSAIEAIEAGVAASLFVDAILPQPGLSWLDTAPVQLRDHLLGKLKNEQLPPWCDWFAPEILKSLLPDEATRARFFDELRPLPLAYFREREPLASHWPVDQCGYLQLSASYALEAHIARTRGWTVRSEESNHLAMVTSPDDVASSLISMLVEMRTLGA